MDRIENHYRHEELLTTNTRPHRAREPYKARWCDGPFALLVGAITVVCGIAFGNGPMGYFVLGVLAFMAGLLANEGIAFYNYLLGTPPLFTFANRLYVAIRRWSRTSSVIIATKYKLNQRVETVDYPGCMSRVQEICAYRGKIYYRLNGFQGDYREHELKEG